MEAASSLEDEIKRVEYQLDVRRRSRATSSRRKGKEEVELAKAELTRDPSF